MTRLFRRARRLEPADRDEFTRRVRRSLDEQARRAPEGAGFAERVIAAAERSTQTSRAGRPPAASPRPRRRVLAPGLAVVAVLALLAAVLSVALLNRGGADGGTSAAHQNPTPASSGTPVSPTSAVPHSDSPSAQATPAADQVVRLTALSNVRILDLSFSTVDHGWALASADCLRTAGRCTAMLHTTDGSTWTSYPNPPANVAGVNGCAAPCITDIRFATDQIGYAYGPAALFMTTDGGQSWSRQVGGALGLESSRGTVVRLTSTGDGCPGPCGLAVATAANGSADWVTRQLGAAPGGMVDSVSLVRNADDVYVLVTGNPAGGASRAVSTLYRSTDGGTTWATAGEPCLQAAGQEWDSVTVAAGDDGQVVTLCRLRGTSQSRLAVSTDGGATFSVGPSAPQREGLLAVGGAGRYLLALDGLSGTTDGGAHWSTAAGPVPSFVWLGFESGTVARVVGNGGSFLWTTRDGGSTWRSARFA